MMTNHFNLDGPIVNNQDRQNWVINLPGLWEMFLNYRAASGRIRPSNSTQCYGIQRFVREHRADIDREILAERARIQYDRTIR